MKPRTQWTDEMIETEIRSIAVDGIFPSASQLREHGRNDLACIISKNGGFLAWSERLGIPRAHSDSDTGWEGEIAVQKLFADRGYLCERSEGAKAPHDLTVNNALRVDVKAARYAEYGPCRGWFYRIGKVPQADLVFLYQLDTGNFYSMPWWECPKTNVTISREGGKYARHLNNWDLIDSIIANRAEEQRKLTA